MAIDYQQLAAQIKQWAQELGFQQLGITGTDLSNEEPKLQAWLEQGYHGEMQYMAEHGMLRARPAELLPGTLRVLSVRMDYLPAKAGFATNLADPAKAYISRYALGRDYHKLVRNRLKQLANKIRNQLPELSFRPFVDSAPVLERPLAQRAGLGWVGKHSLLLNHGGGSWFFLGELLVDIPLPVDEPHNGDCGSCVACITSCPTGAIVAPYIVDGRRCISYLTIELKTAIPKELRPLIGNRIYGCDDCQLVCPENRETPLSIESDFQRRPQWQDQDLLQLFAWDEPTFLRLTEGSAIRRIGFERWQRNIAVALGNAPYQSEIINALQHARVNSSVLVAEHIDWALAQQKRKSWQAANLLPRATERLVRIIQKGLPRDA
ncbi:tRNA epoxyqueuosine(34) reductase QueG [Arsukibacterium sp.]|uniref:tRNA epoxyqueuosine(34) reductase QueG n=1 Tax=Arsukibacterium sp. TaxID=1977258 RepID=UPI001BD55532|nr:tRNA epoxyqueuosine(34) reductase QueG [Arsukibacterium sp.]